MSGAVHTPGPWFVCETPILRVVAQEDHPTICEMTCLRDYGDDTDELLANARLIASAPALQEHADAMAEALAQRDRTAAECPVDSLNPVIRKQNQDRCTICGSGVRDACGRKSSANYAFIEAARVTLAAYQATKP